jgi:hypothetical protein
MVARREEVTQIFLQGIGLKTALSCVPPIAVAWIFFILYLRVLSPAEFWTALGLGLAGIAAGSVVVIRLILSIVPPLHRIIEVTQTANSAARDTGAIVRNIEEAATGTPQVSDHIHTVGLAAQSTGDTAASISAAASALAEQSGRLQHEVENFLGQVRAG